MHFVENKFDGEYLKTNWEDLNMQARKATIPIIGLAYTAKRQTGHVVATQSFIKFRNYNLLSYFNVTVWMSFVNNLIVLRYNILIRMTLCKVII